MTFISYGGFYHSLSDKESKETLVRLVLGQMALFTQVRRGPSRKIINVCTLLIHFVVLVDIWSVVFTDNLLLGLYIYQLLEMFQS